MDFDDMLAAVRHNLVASYEGRVRRAGRFEVYLVDPTAVGHLSPTPEEFQRWYSGSISATLEAFDTCRAFLPGVPEAYAAGTLTEAILEDAFGPAHVEEWSALGAHPAHWLRSYLDVAIDATYVRLVPEVQKDWLFWWWLMCGQSVVWVVLSNKRGTGNPDEVLARTFDPTIVGGEGKEMWAEPLAYAKGLTRRSDHFCMLLHPDKLRASVVSSAGGAQRLFKKAVQVCTISRRLWAKA